MPTGVALDTLPGGSFCSQAICRQMQNYSVGSLITPRMGTQGQNAAGWGGCVSTPAAGSAGGGSGMRIPGAPHRSEELPQLRRACSSENLQVEGVPAERW